MERSMAMALCTCQVALIIQVVTALLWLWNKHFLLLLSRIKTLSQLLLFVVLGN